jgi:hypothetical protein
MTITGKIIEIGDLNYLAYDPAVMKAPTGITILVSQEQLAAMKENLLYAKVKIELVKE